MEEDNIIIKLSGVKKRYRLGQIGGRTLQEDFESWWAKKRGKEDPNSKVGAGERISGNMFMALNGIDLTVYKGDRLGIIGANGAGKSTLLKLLSRITAPTEGEIDIYGRISAMLEVGTGFHREMTGRENIYLCGSILGMTKTEIESKMEDIIEFSEIREFIDTPIKRYSSGMFVKLAFSVSAFLSSEIIIMDEVLAVGDMAFQNKCLERMRTAAEDEGRTILYVSHNMNTIRRLCSRCIVLDQGRLIFDGDTESAIAIYMDKSLGKSDVDIDLTERIRNGGSIGKALFMKRLFLPEKTVPIYEAGEDLVLRITLDVKKRLKNVVFRITLRSDSDSGIGTVWSEKMSFEEADERDIIFSMPLNVLAKGIFYASIGFYTEDSLGRKTALDHITRAFRIEIPGNPLWNTETYGFINLPEISIIE